VSHEADHGPLDHCIGIHDRPLVVTREPSALRDPGKCALDDPTPLQHHEAMLSFCLLHNLYDDAERLLRPADELADITAVGEGVTNARIFLPYCLDHYASAVVVLY